MSDTDFDSLCDEFEAAWKSEDHPRIEDFLARAECSTHGRLLTELLQIELWWRHDSPSVNECIDRFPELKAAVEVAFEAFRQRSVQQQSQSEELNTTNPGEEEYGEEQSGGDASGEMSLDQYFTVTPEDQDQARSSVSQLYQAWESASDREPKLADFIPDNVSAEMRGLILKELLLADVNCRKQVRKEVPLAEYLSQFPNEKTVVESAFKLTSTPDNQKLPDTTRHANRTGQTSRVRSGSALPTGTANARYQATRLHAKGGLGVVYRAKDKELNRTVALKEIKFDHALEPESQARFVFEAEVTGSLEHPGIVPIYGMGRYTDKRPYYAMRFIRGESFKEAINDFHQTHRDPSTSVFYERDFRSLLRRLIEACNAIHYAHEHGVLHRDIKPDNVMLGKYGETLVVDWGLAKLMTSEQRSIPVDTESTMISVSSGSATSLGSAMGTPQYMSPEQAHGQHDSLSYSSDVYSLGAMLLTIVTGKLPVDGKHPTEGRRLSGREIVWKVQRGEVQRVKDLTPAAPAALASIVDKAMHLEPVMRYQTAVALSEDVERWLSDEAVEAHVDHETLSERVGRFIRRNRGWTVSIASALAAITVIALIASLWINNARKEEKIAKLEARNFKQEAVQRYQDSRRAIDTWLVQSDEAMKFLPGTRSIRQRMLQVAIEDYAKLAAKRSRDPDLELERGRALVRLGDLSQLLNQFSPARDYYQQAIETLGKPHNEVPPSTMALVEAANARVRIGLAYAGEENLDDAESAYQSAINDMEPLRKTGLAEANSYCAAAYVNYAELSLQRGNDQQAIEQLGSAIDVYEETEKNDEARLLGHARALEILGRTEARVGNHVGALKHFARAAQILSPAVADQPDHLGYLDALASVFVSRATSYRTQGALKDEIESLAEALKHYQALHNSMPDMPLYVENLALTQTDLGIALFESDLPKEARMHLTNAYELSANLVDAYGQVPRFRIELAACQDALGQVMLITEEDAAGAKQLLADSVVAYDLLMNQFPDHPEYFERLAVAQSHYGQALDRAGEHADAVANMEQSIKTLEQLIEAFADRISLVNALAHVRQHLGHSIVNEDKDRAESLFAGARDDWTTLCRDHPFASYQTELASLLAACPVESIRDPEQAVRYALAAVEAAARNPRYTATLALAYAMHGNSELSLKSIEQTKILRGNLVGRDLLIRAIAESKSGEKLKAIASVSSAKQWFEQNASMNRAAQHLLSLAESATER